MIKILRLFSRFTDPTEPDEASLRVTGSKISILCSEIGGCDPALPFEQLIQNSDDCLLWRA